MLPSKLLWEDLFSRKSDTELTVISTLKSNQLFLLLNPREIAQVANCVHVRHYEPGETIFSQYEKGLGMYIIAKGNVEIKIKLNKKYLKKSTHESTSTSTTPADELLITTLKSGSFFGELALIDHENQRTASAYALGPTTLIGFFKPDLLEIMERKPETGVKILFQLSKVLGKRLNETTEALSVASQETLQKSDKEKPKVA